MMATTTTTTASKTTNALLGISIKIEADYCAQKEQQQQPQQQKIYCQTLHKNLPNETAHATLPRSISLINATKALDNSLIGVTSSGNNNNTIKTINDRQKLYHTASYIDGHINNNDNDNDDKQCDVMITLKGGLATEHGTLLHAINDQTSKYSNDNNNNNNNYNNNISNNNDDIIKKNCEKPQIEIVEVVKLSEAGFQSHLPKANHSIEHSLDINLLEASQEQLNNNNNNNNNTVSCPDVTNNGQQQAQHKMKMQSQSQSQSLSQPQSQSLSQSSSSSSSSSQSKSLLCLTSTNIICNNDVEKAVNNDESSGSSSSNKRDSILVITTQESGTVDYLGDCNVSDVTLKTGLHVPKTLLPNQTMSNDDAMVKNSFEDLSSALTETVCGYTSRDTQHVVKIKIQKSVNNNNNNNSETTTKINNNNNNINIINNNNIEIIPITEKQKLNSIKKQITIVQLKETERSFDVGKIENFLNVNSVSGEQLLMINPKIPNNNIENKDMVMQKSSSTDVNVGSTNTSNSMQPNVPDGTTVTELNVTNTPYLYYMVSSGQFSPCETLDSGTGSDMENQTNLNRNNVAGNKINSNGNDLENGISIVGDVPKLEMHLKTTKLRVGNSNSSCESSSISSGVSVNVKKLRKDNEHAYCLTDSEESESSSLSCDSLHSNEYARQSSVSPIGKTNHQIHKQHTTKRVLGTFLPDSLLRDIRDRKFSENDIVTKYRIDNENENDSDSQHKTKLYETNGSGVGVEGMEPTYESLEQTDLEPECIELTHAIKRITFADTVHHQSSRPSKAFIINQENGAFVDMKLNSMPCKYETDKYYNFHVKEHENYRSFGNNNTSMNGTTMDTNADDTSSLCEFDAKNLNIMDDDAFAGYKDIRCGSNSSTIRSSKGTVRGVKNRVRNGIATFLQLQQPNVKNYKEKDLGKVVLYTTSMGIIRDTYAKCANVKQILRTLLIKFEERDVFMSLEYQQEIRERMHSDTIRVPQLFVEGQHIGDADTVERLNESGELRQLLKPYKSISTTYTCQTCGGYRLLPCPSCNGSKKSVHRNHFTAEFVALKCMNCDEVGLVKCHNC